MVRCTVCGKSKGWLSSGWRECKNCGALYCSNCKNRLKTKGLIFKTLICIRCGHKI